MKLKPFIASYSGQTASRMKSYLNHEVLDLIARVALVPQDSIDIEEAVLSELVEMHVLREEHGLVRLQTSVFLKDDIEHITQTIRPLAAELSELIVEQGSDFGAAPPEVTLFLGGIIALGQGLSVAVRTRGNVVDWRNYGGKYAKSKVDFNEICVAYVKLGPDSLNKSILRGERYTAVFIGSGGTSFPSLLPMMDTAEQTTHYRDSLNRYLADAYALLVRGELQNDDLRISAELANIFENGEPTTSVVTHQTIQKYQDAMERITAVASSYYTEKLPALNSLLSSTTAGRQGVPPENMHMNLWRCIRRITARELYAKGFFTDTIPDDGTLTVFYANGISFIDRFL